MSAKTIYVAPIAHPPPGCGTREAPCELAVANANAEDADTIILLSGHYPPGRLNVTAQNLSFIADEPGKAIICVSNPRAQSFAYAFIANEVQVYMMGLVFDRFEVPSVTLFGSLSSGTFERCRWQNSTATAYPPGFQWLDFPGLGGLAVYGQGELSFSNCEFENIKAIVDDTSYRGLAIYMSVFDEFPTSLSLTNCSFNSTPMSFVFLTLSNAHVGFPT